MATQCIELPVCGPPMAARHVYYRVCGKAEAQLGNICITFTPTQSMIVYSTSFMSSAWPDGFVHVMARSPHLGEIAFFISEDALRVITRCDHCRRVIKCMALCRDCFCAAYCSHECRTAAAPAHRQKCGAPQSDDLMARLQLPSTVDPPSEAPQCNRRCRRSGMCACVAEMLVPCKT